MTRIDIHNMNKMLDLLPISIYWICFKIIPLRKQVGTVVPVHRENSSMSVQSTCKAREVFTRFMVHTCLGIIVLITARVMCERAGAPNIYIFAPDDCNVVMNLSTCLC